MSTLPKPIFLFSLPRSGSTLTQRMLATHEEISTASEPWILLPLVYALRECGIYTEYEQGLTATAIGDFCQLLPNGREDYLSEVRMLALHLYAKVSRSKGRYFLDKTPRYDLIAEDIIRLFPEGKFIFLWRNPLAVAASLIETPWAGRGARKGGRWNLYRFKTDLFDGLENLIGAYQRYSNKVHAARYEDLVADPTRELAQVFEYLDLSYDPAVLEDFGGVKLHGRYKDPTGIERYGRISQEPLDKWKQTIDNPIRKAWFHRYLRWIGAERLGAMGYSLEQLRRELDSVPTSSRHLGSDISYLGYGLIHSFLEPAILEDKLRLLPAWHRIHRHH